MHVNLKIKPFSLGDWQTNCYVVWDEAARDAGCWIIDPGFDPAEMIQWVEAQSLTPTHVLLTHGHLDHIAGLDDVRRQWRDLPILIHPLERAFLTDPTLNLSVAVGLSLVMPEATGVVEHGDVLRLGGASFEVRHTPGHSPGGVTFYEAGAGIAIVGDTLFAGSIGRHDFPTSNPADLMRAIREQLLNLPDATKVLPGHGPSTTIGVERATNPWIQPSAEKPG